MRPTFDPSSQSASSQLSFIERARRSQIVAAAIEVIVEEGIGQASLARIAARAGISKGVVSYHFAGKDALMTQVVVSVYEAGAEFMTPHIRDAADPRAQLAAYLRSNVAFIAANAQEVRAVTEIVTGYRPDAGGPLFDPGTQATIAAPLEDMLRTGQKDGSFRDFDPRVMAHAVRGAIDAIGGQLERRGDLDLEAYADELVTLFDLATQGDPA